MPIDSDITAKAVRRIQKARTQMLTTQVNGRYPLIFWATAALQLQLRPMPDMMARGGAMGFIGTDGTYIIFDPARIADESAISERQMISIIAHEVSHCVKGDLWRRGDRLPDVWNIAADMRIDPELIASGLEPPDHGSPEANLRFHDMKNNGRSAEEIYKELMQDPPQGGGGSMGGDIRDPCDPTSGAVADPIEKRHILEDLERRWNIIARQAAEHAKAQGHLPNGYEHLVEPVKPRLNPWDLIRHYVSMCRRDDYSWARPNRRSAWRGLTLPSLYSQGIGEILIGIDTSGSCTAQAPIFLGFLGSVLSEVKPERTVLMECDAYVHQVTEFAAGDELPPTVPVHGYGGTSMAPIWEKAHELNLDPVCAIVLTDLGMTEADFGPPQPFPVLWLSSEEGSAPWGQMAYLPAAS